MKNIWLIVLLAANVTFAKQNKKPGITYTVRCTYQLAYQPDSTNPVKKSETFVLFLGNEQSLFQSKTKFLKDSFQTTADASGRSTQTSMDFYRQNQTNFDYNIIKKGCGDITTVDRVYHDFYAYKDVFDPGSWVILNDTATIVGYHCQKAQANFGGRQWFAWFTSEIPIPDGPYKFCGLPGLIVRLVDVKAFYDFTLVGLQEKNKEIVEWNGEKLNTTTKAKYFKKLKNYNENPIGVAEQSGVVFTSGRNEIMQRLQQRAKENNNPIELIKD